MYSMFKRDENLRMDVNILDLYYLDSSRLVTITMECILPDVMLLLLL